jgi:hypothetical protein
MASAWDNLNGDFASRLRGLLAEAGGKITIVSGYRSPARQQQLWANALVKYGSPEEARKWVAPPGHSNHERGLAADLGGDIQLAHVLAPKYGLTFPMAHEAWHIEPIGARAMSSPSAYTDPPDEAQGAVSETRAGVDHIDNLYGKFSEMLSGNVNTRVGEADTTGVGLGATAAVGAGATPNMNTVSGQGDDTGAPMSGATVPKGGANDIDKFMAAIGGQESGGNYNARNSGSGAAGKYQIMPANWGPWAQEAGLGANAPMTAVNQERVARFKINQYYQQFGDWGKVAKAWYSGPGNVNKNVGGGKGYPTSDAYAQQVLARMGAD